MSEDRRGKISNQYTGSSKILHVLLKEIPFALA